MGLRCLLGHDFDEPETERERNEEGNEVVVTVREVKTCTRCGEKQVVSENKEITSIAQLRESATGEPAGTSSSRPADTETAAGGEWGTDELSTGAESVDAGGDTTEAPTDTATAPDSTSSTDSTPNAESADAESTAAPEQTDPVDRGVADIIEQAEKDDDMLESPPDASESTNESASESESGEADSEDDEEVPVHPGKRSAEAEASEGPDAEGDDGVILDDGEDSPPEDARRQWEEEASPEDVPQDLSVTDSSDDGDAVIIDEEGETEQPVTEPQSEPTDTHSAVDSEDAEIMDTGPETTPEESTETMPEGSTEPAQPEPETTEPEREETDEGHMPWPDAPGEDEGHDATAPDSEPADIEFGGGIAPSDDAADEGDTEIIDADEVDAAKSAESADTAEDRANGHRTEDGNASTAPTANIDLERSTRDAGMEYFCPECGLTRDVGNSSMRAGDICPECRKGYITEQQKAE